MYLQYNNNKNNKKKNINGDNGNLLGIMDRNQWTDGQVVRLRQSKRGDYSKKQS
jgi:hypothetical protein